MSAQIVDDRTKQEQLTHTWLVIGTDTFLSGWGQAKGIPSYAAWACKPDDVNRVFNWVESRSDMKRVREALAANYHPSGVHLHIYVVTPNHPALG